ncbi:hypothetical protein E3N88_39362 [Mikania micrantha]|uniref:Uncharacterized protein n=1 Tax=Mikania micrantha TaxID=192012 RepID=A0A5N6LXF1_9ASTR|nr:hypothetical protein E3N88_39362 [Mikania micrantha]
MGQEGAQKRGSATLPTPPPPTAAPAAAGVSAPETDRSKKPLTTSRSQSSVAWLRFLSYVVPSASAPYLNWDEERRLWLNRNQDFPNVVNGKARILLVTGSPPNPCDNAIGDHYLLKSIKNKIDYCRIHGIEIVYNMAHLDKAVWILGKIAIDSQLPLSKYKDHNMVIHGYPDLLFNQKSWIALNTGSFLFRNCQWSLDLLDDWAPMGPKGPVREEEAGKF